MNFLTLRNFTPCHSAQFLRSLVSQLTLVMLVQTAFAGPPPLVKSKIYRTDFCQSQVGMVKGEFELTSFQPDTHESKVAKVEVLYSFTGSSDLDTSIKWKKSGLVQSSPIGEGRWSAYFSEILVEGSPFGNGTFFNSDLLKFYFRITLIDGTQVLDRGDWPESSAILGRPENRPEGSFYSVSYSDAVAKPSCVKSDLIAPAPMRVSAPLNTVAAH